MKNNNAALFVMLLVGILIGSGVGYMFAGVGTVQADSSRGLTNTSTPGLSQSKSPVRAEPTLVAANSELIRELPVKAPTPLVSESQVASLVSEVEVHAIPSEKGEGAIFGRVVDDEGLPMNGVVMRLSAHPDNYRAIPSSKVGQGAPALPSLKETVRKAAQEYQDSRGHTIETRTDERGEYRFEDLMDYRWSVAGYLEGYEVESNSSNGRVRVGGELDFTAYPVLQIPVDVVMPDGSQPSLADITVKQMGTNRGSRGYAWTPREPFLRLVPGRYELRAYSHDDRGTKMADLASEEVKIGFKAGIPPESVQLTLAARLSITGYIRASKTEPEGQSYMVRTAPLAAEQEVNLDILSSSDVQDWTQPGSLFTFSDLTAGRYLVGVSRGWNGPVVAHEVVDLIDSIVEIRLDLPEVDPGEVLRVIALESSGEPLDGVHFYMEQKTEGGSGSSGVQTTRDKEGAYIISIPDEFQEDYFGKGASHASYSLQASQEEWGSQEVSLNRGQTEVTVEFEVPGTLHVTVPGYLGSGYEGRLRIMSTKKQEDGSRHYFGGNGRDKVEPDGTRTLEGLTPGVYVVSLMVEPKGASRHSWYGGRSVNSAEIEVRAGDNSLALTLPALYGLRVHWTEGKVGDSLYLSSDDEESHMFGNNEGEFDASGIATWEDLPAGQYTLNRYSGESQMMEISIPCGEIEFVPMLLNAMRVSISDSQGNLAKAGFAHGDLVIGLDGKDFEGQDDISAVWGKLQAKDSELEFILLRNNTQVTLTVSGANLSDWGSLGGELEPTSR